MKKKLLLFFCIFFGVLILFLFFFQPIDSISDIHTTPEISITDSQNNELIHYIQHHKTTPVDLSQMNEKNIAILLDIEDKNFYKHSGFNISRICKTIFSNIINQESSGASTITQQYIKNTYLNNDKSIWRKIKELYYAIKLEQVASKEEILSGYLNCIYLGNDVYGIANGAKYYFNTHYSNLTTQQMVVLVALLNAPTHYSNDLEALENKKNNLLKVLLQDQIITQEEYFLAIKPIEFQYIPYLYNSNLLYFADGVIKEYTSLNLNPKFNKMITIKTRYQKEMNSKNFYSAANYASIAVDKEGYILSIVGDKNYYTSSFNIATQGKRDIGSTIKPILYYEALKCGYTPKTSYYSGPYSFTYHNELVTIKNNASIYPYKSISMKEALATSDNIYAMKTHQAIGFKTLANHLKKYNIEASALPSLALGSVGMSLFELTRIYSQFFTEGTYLDFKYIESIQREDKNIYTRSFQMKSLGEKAYFKTIKNLMASVFDSTIPHATASSIQNSLKTKCYGKSGLTDYDSYMMGFSDDVLVGVWAGYLNNHPLEDTATKRLPKEIFASLINSYTQS